MNGQDLKNSILQLAIQGKLVPQDPNDEPASELLAKIRKEKERLVKDGKLKKKDLVTTPISDEEKPFEIPESWEWCRLNELALVARGGSPRPIKEYITQSPEGVNWIKIGDTEKGGKYINRCAEKIKPEGVRHSRLVHPGDFLLTNSMSFGRPYITNVDGCIHDGWLVISQYFQGYKPDFLYFLLSSPFAFSQFSEKTAGAVVQNLNKDKVAESVFPLPPLSEQHRIVAKIEEVMPLVEEYDKAQTKLDNLNSELPEQLKQSILQEAIMGKLGTQDPNDEPASELLKRIRKEKEQLVKEKKIKKEKALPEISDEEKPFDIPDNWVWARLQTICQIEDGEKKNGKHICMDAKFLRGKSSGELIDKGKFVLHGDKIILVDGENSGEVFECPIDGYMGSTFKKLWISDIANIFYVMYLLKMHKDMFRNSKKGAAIPHLNKDLFRELLIPLPPLAEQHRIVEKLDELLPKIDKLRK